MPQSHQGLENPFFRHSIIIIFHDYNIIILMFISVTDKKFAKPKIFKIEINRSLKLCGSHEHMDTNTYVVMNCLFLSKIANR